jgi:Coenzyme PQQ synthesis protein D (PqqD)
MTQFIIYFKINAPKVVFENYENEVVLINLYSGIYYSISNTAAEIFSQIEQEKSKVCILDGVINKYEGNTPAMVASVEKFLEDLLNEGLIIREEKKIDTSSSADKEKVNKNTNPVKLLFEAPVLNRYTDMQDLLLLDPVHDVDKTGWPNPKPPDSDKEV